jgi:predicted dithiol-disulfide oxidoreductase (DUF899 family)
MQYQNATAQLGGYRRQIEALREEMRKVQAAIEPQPVTDYVFQTPTGEVTLSSLFGNKADLFVIHNMGTGCPYCTMWADGFNGVYAHLADRAAFVLSSPDTPAVQQQFARSRGWRFPMVSHQGTGFAADMGYTGGSKGGFMPGVSVFKRNDAQVVRVSDTNLGPGDDFCSVWHFFDLLPEGANGWRAKFSYGAS